LEKEGFFTKVATSQTEAVREYSRRDYGVMIARLSSQDDFKRIRQLQYNYPTIGETTTLLGIKEEGDDDIDKRTATALLATHKVDQRIEIVPSELDNVLTRLKRAVYRSIPTSGAPTYRTDTIINLEPVIFRMESALKPYVRRPDYTISIKEGSFEISGNNKETQDAIDALRKPADFGSEYNPVSLKMNLAYRIVRALHGEAAADAAQEHFRKAHQERGIPPNLLSYPIKPEYVRDGQVRIVDIMTSMGIPSKTEAKRLLSQNAVEIARLNNGSNWTGVDITYSVPVGQLDNIVLRVGRNYGRFSKPS